MRSCRLSPAALRLSLLFAFALVIGQCAGGGCGCEGEGGNTPKMQMCEGQITPCPYVIPATDEFGDPNPELNRQSVPLRITPTGFDRIREKIEGLFKKWQTLQGLISSFLDPNEPVAGPIDVLGLCTLNIYIRDVDGDCYDPTGNPISCAATDTNPADGFCDKGFVCNPAIYFDPMPFSSHWYDKCTAGPEAYMQLPLNTVDNTINMSLRIYDFSLEIDFEGCDFLDWARFSAKVVDVGQSEQNDYCGKNLPDPPYDGAIVGKIDPVRPIALSPYPSIMSMEVNLNSVQMIDPEVEINMDCGILDFLCDGVTNFLANLLLDTVLSLLTGTIADLIEGFIIDALAEIFPLDMIGFLNSWVQPSGYGTDTEEPCQGADPLWCTLECNPFSGRYYGSMPLGQLFYGVGFYPYLDINCQDWPTPDGCPQGQEGFFMPFDFGLRAVEDDWNLITNTACLESIVAAPPPNPPGIDPTRTDPTKAWVPAFSSASFNDPTDLGNPNNGLPYDVSFGMSQYLLQEIMYDMYVSGMFCSEIPSATGSGSIIPLIGSLLPIDSFLLNPSQAETIMPGIKKLVGENCPRPILLRTIPRGVPTVRVGEPRWQSSSIPGGGPCNYNFVCNADETPASCPMDCRADINVDFNNLDIDFIVQMGSQCIPQRVLSVRTNLAMQIGFDYFTGEGYCPLADDDGADNPNDDPVCTPSKNPGGVDCTDSAKIRECCAYIGDVPPYPGQCGGTQLTVAAACAQFFTNMDTCCNANTEYGCKNDEFGSITDPLDCHACAVENFEAPVSCDGLDNNDGTDDDDTCLQLFVDMKFDVEDILFSDIGYQNPATSGLGEFLGQVFETSLFTCDLTSQTCIKTKVSIPGVRLKFLHMGAEPNPTESNDLDGNGANDYMTIYSQLKDLTIVDKLLQTLLPVCGNGKCDSGEDSIECPADCPPPATCFNGTCDSGEDIQNCPSDCYCGNGFCDAAAGENQNAFDPDDNPGGCPSECFCGNTVNPVTGTRCEPWENANAFNAVTNPNGCQGDCDPVCGNCVCESEGATVETTTNCYGDCVEAFGLRECGDARCDACFETIESCSADCHPTSCQGAGLSFALSPRRASSYQPEVAPGIYEPQTFLAVGRGNQANERIVLSGREAQDYGIGPGGGTVRVTVEDPRDSHAGYSWRLNYVGGEGAWKNVTDEPVLTLPSFLPQGTHTLEVRGVNRGHGIDGTPATLTFTVDTQPPDIRISGPQAGRGHTSVFTILVEDFVDKREAVQVTWSLDGSEPVALNTESLDLTDLDDGSSHTLIIHAVDRTGNENSAARVFTVNLEGEVVSSCVCATVGSSAPFNPSALLPVLLVFLFWSTTRLVELRRRFRSNSPRP